MNKDDLLFEDSRTVDDIIREVAEEEGMTYEQVLKAYNAFIQNSSETKNKKAATKKAKGKRKQAKKSRKRNRK